MLSKGRAVINQGQPWWKRRHSRTGGPELCEVWESEQNFGKSIRSQCSGERTGLGQDVWECWWGGGDAEKLVSQKYHVYWFFSLRWQNKKYYLTTLHGLGESREARGWPEEEGGDRECGKKPIGLEMGKGRLVAMVGPRSFLGSEAGEPQVPRDGWPGAIQGNRQDVRISDL